MCIPEYNDLHISHTIFVLIIPDQYCKSQNAIYKKNETFGT